MDTLTARRVEFAARRIIFGILTALLILFFGVIWWVLGDIPQTHDLGCGFEYDEELQHITYWERGKINPTDPTDKSIPPKVTDYKVLQDVIYVRQERKFPPSVMYPAYIYPESKDNIYYWIILKKTRTVIGPLTKEEFDNNPYSASF